MRRYRVLAVAAGAAAVWWAAPLAAGGAAVAGAGPGGHGVSLAGTWRKAIKVPGLGALNKGGDAGVSSVSCGSAGNCAAGGWYLDNPRGNGNYQGFVVSERNGTWGKAIKVPGLGVLNKSDAGVSSVSCASARNCAAGGSYEGVTGTHAFVVSERNGTWGAAIEVPGSGMLNKGDARVGPVSCASAGNCAAGGAYWAPGNPGHFQGFVVSEINGTWRTAINVPGLGALNTGGGAGVSSVSCGSAGNCAAGGSYTDTGGFGHNQAFVVSERNGTWGKAIEVPGSGALNTGAGPLAPPRGGVSSVSCAPVGNCAAGGFYTDGFGNIQAFVVSQR